MQFMKNQCSFFFTIILVCLVPIVLSCDITGDTNIPVKTISVNPSSLKMEPNGATRILTAIITPSNSTNQGYSWKSSNTAIAIVSVQGLVIPLKAGTAIITATTTDGGFTASCTVTVAIAVSGISIFPNTLDLIAGGTAGTLSASITPSNASDKQITWTSSDEIVATVSSSGVVTPLSEGTTAISATTNDGEFSTSCTVNVKPAVTGISMNPTYLELKAGGSAGILAVIITPLNAGDPRVSWTTSNSAVAIVSSTGIVTPLSMGTAIITATTIDGQFTASGTVNVSTPVTGVTVSPSNLNLIAGGAAGTISATIVPISASEKGITWTSSNAAIATVNSEGVVTPLVGGTAVVTATTVDGHFPAACTVNVAVSVTGISLSPNELNLVAGGTTGALQATIIPWNASDTRITWASSNGAVATVSSAGVVTPLSGGTVVVTARTVNGQFTAACSVNVAVSVTGVTISPNQLNLTAGGATATLTATITPSSATNKIVSWISNNETVVAVSSAGVVTPLTKGNAVVTATTVDGQFTASCSVTVSVPVTSVTVSPSELNLIAGGATGTLTATIMPSTASNNGITWTSNNQVVATVNSAGVVTPLAGGTALVTATTSDGHFTSSCMVTVVLPRTTFYLSTEPSKHIAKTYPTLPAGVTGIQIYLYSDWQVYSTTIPGDIQGTEYNFSFILASTATLTFYADIVLNPGATETILASTSFSIVGSTYTRYSRTVTGTDPYIPTGGTLAVRIRRYGSSNTTAILFSPTDFNYIAIPPIN